MTVTRPLVWLGVSAPALWLLVATLMGWLGPNPAETLLHHTGVIAVVLLLVTLAVTPLRRWVGWRQLVRHRRTLGVAAWCYAFAHFLVFAILDWGLELAGIWSEVVERPYITVGFAALVLLTPLAITSTRGWIRRLGRNWRRLHRLVYPAAILAVAHIWWLLATRKVPEISEAIAYAAILAVLLLLRLNRFTRHAPG